MNSQIFRVSITKLTMNSWFHFLKINIIQAKIKSIGSISLTSRQRRP
jgi:hypothetical protein